MDNKFEGLPEFVVNISSNLLMKLNKFGVVLFVNNKAKCVFNEIDVNKSLKFIVQADDWVVLNKNIEIALYNQYLHHFYWKYKEYNKNYKCNNSHYKLKLCFIINSSYFVIHTKFSFT